MRASKARRLRALIEALADHLEDKEALEAVELFRPWIPSGEYEQDGRVQYEGKLYRCLLTHTGQEGWTPEDAPSLWARVLIPDENVVPEWVQPDSTSAYKTGDTVSYQGRIWVSIYDNNVWEPGVYGWEEVS